MDFVRLQWVSSVGNPKEGFPSVAMATAGSAAPGSPSFPTGLPLIATLRDDIVYPPIFPAHLSRQAMALLCGLLHFNPDCRMSVRDALLHPFVTMVPKGTHEELFRDDIGSPTGDGVGIQEDGDDGSPVGDGVFFALEASALQEGLPAGAGGHTALPPSLPATSLPSSVTATPASSTLPSSTASGRAQPPSPPSGVNGLPLQARASTASGTPSSAASAVTSAAQALKGLAPCGLRAQEECLGPQSPIIDPNNTPGIRTPVLPRSDPNAPSALFPGVGAGRGSPEATSTQPSPSPAASSSIGTTPCLTHGSNACAQPSSATPVDGVAPVYGSLRDHMRTLPNSAAASGPRQSPLGLHVLSSAVVAAPVVNVAVQAATAPSSFAGVPPLVPVQHVLLGAFARHSTSEAAHNVQIIRGPSFNLSSATESLSPCTAASGVGSSFEDRRFLLCCRMLLTCKPW